MVTLVGTLESWLHFVTRRSNLDLIDRLQNASLGCLWFTLLITMSCFYHLSSRLRMACEVPCCRRSRSRRIWKSSKLLRLREDLAKLASGMQIFTIPSTYKC